MRIIMLLLLIGIGHWAGITQAQDETACPPVRFLPGQQVTVTGSRDFGGLPYRDRPTLDTPVSGILPIGTVITTTIHEECSEGRRWLYIPDEAGRGGSWIVDGADGAAWLEPVGACAGTYLDQIVPMHTGQNLSVEGIDAEAGIIRFSMLLLSEDRSRLVAHYFNYDLRSGGVTDVPYWHADLITRDLTDRLGITETVFNDAGEDFGEIFVAPDRRHVLYTRPTPLDPACQTCFPTQTLHIATIDGREARPLGEIFGRIARVVWTDTTVMLSAINPLYPSPEAITVFCRDGGCVLDDHDLIESYGLPFEGLIGLPIPNPTGTHTALRVWSANLQKAGLTSLTIVLDHDSGRIIALPHNGFSQAQVAWLDADTLVYPVGGTGQSPAFGLPDPFYDQDALWEIRLNWETHTARFVGWHPWPTPPGESTPIGSDWSAHTTHVEVMDRWAIVYSISLPTLQVRCLTQG